MSTAASDFAFKPGDLVLVKWNDSMVYFAKIKKIDQRRKKCVVVFDDKSHDEADFDQIHSVDETTTDIICIKCKRDDSDTPNEIVLCDRCGIGYHQKCHTPPIPASALELDTPWNCVYCLKGVKCPYLTESLDVLQNLLSDEECQSHDDMDSITTAESDEGGEEFTQPAVQHGNFLAPPKPQKKRGRKPKVKRGPKPKDPSFSKSKSPAVDVSKQKDGNTASDSGLKTESGLHLKRRRSQFAAVAVQKRPRKSSVQSQTLSVTRISVPVHEGNISPRSEKGDTKSIKANSCSPNQSLPLNSEAPKRSQIPQNSTLEASPQLPPKKPRHLRVSLSLPEEVEPGSPLEKIVMKSEKLHSPKFSVSSLPLWDDDPKTLSSSSETPVKSPAQSTAGNQVGSSSHQNQPNAVSNPSPTPSSEGPLTPFTASALPLKAGGVENKDTRKRKSADEGDEVDTPPLKKANLSSPLGSPADDVFTSPKTSGANGVQRQTTAPSIIQPSIVEPKAADIDSQPSSTANGIPSSEPQMDSNILPGAPVGYGTTLSALEEQATPIAVTPTVITVQPSLEDKAPPHHLSPTSKAELISPVQVTVVKEPTLQTPVALSPDQQAAPERQAVRSLPQVPPITEQSKPIKPRLSSEKVATTGTPVVPVSASGGSTMQTNVQSLPQQNKGPSVIMSSPKQSVSTVTSYSGNSHSSTMPLVKSKPNLPISISTPDDPTKNTAAAVSVITAPVISTASTPTSVPTAVSHVKSAQRHTPRTPNHDIIITSIEMRPQSSTGVSGKIPLSLPSYTEAVQNRIISSTIPPSTTSNVPATTSHALKGKMQTLFAGGKPPGQQTVAGSRRVRAKIADIQPGPVAIQTRSRPQQRSTSQYHQIQSRAAVKPSSTQTPVSVVVAASSSPTVAYTQAMAQDGTAYTIIPADAVVQGGQGVTITTRRAIPPGSLPINSTAVVVQQPAAVKYIIEPGVPAASTSVVYSQTASIPAVTSSQATTSVLPTSIYHVQAPNAKSTQVTTTKPYAIVPAQPTTSVEIPGIAVDQQGTPVVSAQLPVGYSVTPYIHAAVTPTADPAATKQIAYTTEKKPSSTNVPHSKPSSKIVSVSNRGNNHTERALSEQTLANLDEIGKRISEAFVNCSEQMLIAAFEDAWRRFQANGKKYQTTATSRRIGNTETAVSRPVPPNAEVVSVPGTSSRLSLIRPTYSRSKISAPKANSDQLMHVSDAQQLPIQNLGTPSQQKQQVQYLYCPDYPIYAIAPNSTQPPHDQLKQGQTYQVQSSGVYIPVCTSQNNNTIVLEQVIGSKKQPLGQQVSRNQIALTEKAVSIQQGAHQVQHCSALRKTQPNTVVENGGYSVIKQKDSSTVKTVRQCAQCTKEATYLCSGCHRIWYCGKDCQLKAWDEHSESCKS